VDHRPRFTLRIHQSQLLLGLLRANPLYIFAALQAQQAYLMDCLDTAKNRYLIVYPFLFELHFLTRPDSPNSLFVCGLSGHQIPKTFFDALFICRPFLHCLIWGACVSYVLDLCHWICARVSIGLPPYRRKRPLPLTTRREACAGKTVTAIFFPTTTLAFSWLNVCSLERRHHSVQARCSVDIAYRASVCCIYLSVAVCVLLCCRDTHHSVYLPAYLPNGYR